MDPERLFSFWRQLRSAGVVFMLSIQATTTLVGAPPPIGFTPLFNGNNLEGFYSWLVDSEYEDPRRVFSVVDGQIRISGDGLGYISTEESYQNYDLYLEFRWGKQNWKWGDRIGKARDSGLFLNATGSDGNSVDGNGAFMAAIECNIFQGATGDILLIRGQSSDDTLISPTIRAKVKSNKDPDGWFTWDPLGIETQVKTMGRVNWRAKSTAWRDILDFRGANDVESKVGEWNVLECECRPDRITILLNGIKVNQITPLFPQSGKILLQCEGSEIFFRQLAIRPVATDH